MKVHLFKTVIAGLLISLLLTSVSAQNLLFQTMPKDNSQIGLRFLRPNLEADYFDIDMSALSGAYDLYFNIPVRKKINLVGSLPFTTFSAKGENSESMIGNIYIGIQTKKISESGNTSSLSLGLFFPTATEEYTPMLLGLFSNFYEFIKYASNALTIYGNYAYFWNHPKGAIFGIEFGPNYFYSNQERAQ